MGRNNKPQASIILEAFQTERIRGSQTQDPKIVSAVLLGGVRVPFSLLGNTMAAKARSAVAK